MPPSFKELMKSQYEEIEFYFPPIFTVALFVVVIVIVTIFSSLGGGSNMIKEK